MQNTPTPFPTTYREIPVQQLLHVYDAGPMRLRKALEGVTDAQLRAHPIAGKWSILEIALHVTDSELMGATRVRLAVAHPGTRVTGYDQDVWAAKLKYNDATRSDLNRALTLFEALRHHIAFVLRQADEATWETAHVEHPELGPVTLRQLLELYADHGERHLGQVLARRTLLGSPIAMPLLLPNRLY